MSLRNGITLSDGYNLYVAYANICHAGTGHRSVLMTANPIGNGQCIAGVGDMTEGNWYFIEVEYDLVNQTVRARVDGGNWGSNSNLTVWYGAANGSPTKLFNSMSLWDVPPQFWFDDITVYNSSSDTVTPPLHDENRLIMTTSDNSNFADKGYFTSLGINHSGVDLALSMAGSATASTATANKAAYAICDGTVEFSYPTGGVYSFIKVHHPDCDGHDIMAYYGHINPTASGTISKGDPIGSVICQEYTKKGPVLCRKGMQGNNSHVHLTVDTQTQRDLKSIQYEMCDYVLDNLTQNISDLSNCTLTNRSVKLPANKILLRIGWGQVATERYANNRGRSYPAAFYISESAMRQLGFISFFDLY